MATTTLFNQTLTFSPTLLTTLRLLPLLGATASLTHAYMELVTTTSFLATPPRNNTLTRTLADVPSQSQASPPALSASQTADLQDAKDKVIPLWFVNFFNRALWSVIGFNCITTLSSAANVFLVPDGLGEGKTYYQVGLAAAVAHFAFVPVISGSIAALFKIYVAEKESGERGRAEKVLGDWVRVHKLRMGSVDAVAWASLAVGVVKALS